MVSMLLAKCMQQANIGQSQNSILRYLLTTQITLEVFMYKLLKRKLELDMDLHFRAFGFSGVRHFS